MKSAFVIAAIISATLLQGCETTSSLVDSAKNFGKYETGVYVSKTTMDTLVDGKNTQADVINAVGRTSDRQMLGNREVWNYGYTKISSFGGNLSETTVFEFDRKGLLLSHYKTSGNANSGNALTKAAGM